MTCFTTRRNFALSPNYSTLSLRITPHTPRQYIRYNCTSWYHSSDKWSKITENRQTLEQTFLFSYSLALSCILFHVFYVCTLFFYRLSSNLLQMFGRYWDNDGSAARLFYRIIWSCEIYGLYWFKRGCFYNEIILFENIECLWFFPIKYKKLSGRFRIHLKSRIHFINSENW